MIQHQVDASDFVGSAAAEGPARIKLISWSGNMIPGGRLGHGMDTDVAAGECHSPSFGCQSQAGDSNAGLLRRHAAALAEAAGHDRSCRRVQAHPAPAMVPIMTSSPP